MIKKSSVSFEVSHISEAILKKIFSSIFVIRVPHILRIFPWSKYVLNYKLACDLWLEMCYVIENLKIYLNFTYETITQPKEILIEWSEQ